MGCDHVVRLLYQRGQQVELDAGGLLSSLQSSGAALSLLLSVISLTTTANASYILIPIFAGSCLLFLSLESSWFWGWCGELVWRLRLGAARPRCGVLFHEENLQTRAGSLGDPSLDQRLVVEEILRSSAEGGFARSLVWSLIDLPLYCFGVLKRDLDDWRFDGLVDCGSKFCLAFG
ncbi:hypothetical protein Droror1_Dr00018824 [Drosera rotundifolia]